MTIEHRSDGKIYAIIDDNDKRHLVTDLVAVPDNIVKYGVDDIVTVQVGSIRAEGRVAEFIPGHVPRTIIKPAKVVVETARGKLVTRTVDSVTLVKRASKVRA